MRQNSNVCTQLNDFKYYYLVILFVKYSCLIGWFLWHIKPCRLFNAKYCDYMFEGNIILNEPELIYWHTNDFKHFYLLFAHS